MAQSPPDGTTLQPIIKRSLSPSGTISNSALKSPQFSPDPPSPNLDRPTPAASASPSYFFQSHSTGSSPVPGATGGGTEKNSNGGKDATSGHLPLPTPGILLNKNDSSTIRERPQSPPILLQQDPLLRVASPTESNSNRSDSGFSSDGTTVHSPPPVLGSPVQQPTTSSNKPALESLVTGGARATSPPSPHCHFAPLPKPEERPQSRRSSIVSGRVKPFIPRPPERSDTMSTTGGDDEALSTGEYTPSLSPTAPNNSFFHPTSSSEHFSALSQRLSSSLTFAAPTARHPSSPSRPTSRRSSSSRRSRSPSPPGGGLSLRSSSSDHHHHGGHHHRDRSSTSNSSRTHSPNLSRRPSTDALSLHYIEAGAEGGRGGVSLSRQNSRAGSERGGGVHDDVLTMSTGAGIRRPQSTERKSTFDLSSSSSSGGGGNTSNRSTPISTSTPPPPTSTATTTTSTVTPGASTAATTNSSTMIGLHGGSGMMLVDKDKEADLHRLVEKAQHGNLDAERAVSPALHAQAKRERERESSVGRGRSERGSEEVQVVEVGRGDDREEVEELEEVKEEEEEGIDEEDEEDEDEEGNGDTEEDEDDEEEEEEPDRSREEEDDDEEEEEEEPAEERKTSKGAAVEVVRWHRDDPPPLSQVDPTPSIPEDSIAEQEAEEQSAVESQAAGSRRPSTAFAE
ncbi:hypothetical protein JCM5350_005396 [Sporobolomyces pararoseus]